MLEAVGTPPALMRFDDVGRWRVEAGGAEATLRRANGCRHFPAEGC